MMFTFYVRSILSVSLFVLIAQQSIAENNYSKHIDSLVKTNSVRPFNGVILITQHEKPVYSKVVGFSNFDKHTLFTLDSRFVIGSISKQITAVLVLRELDKNHLELDDPISIYLPELTQEWKDSVTIKQLLNHTSGIVKETLPLAFSAGTQFSYSDFGYELLRRIIEKSSGKTYETLVSELFKICKMTNSSYPTKATKKTLVTAYAKSTDTTMLTENETFKYNYIAAGLLISTANDLIKWNDFLHHGKLFSDSIYHVMMTETSLRHHPIWGDVSYGYGIQFTHNDGITEYGHSGYIPGYISMDFYYPETKTSVVVLENIDWKDYDFTQTFHFENLIRNIVRESNLVKKK
ncbi:MAG: serine hydrolase domain-containing protein [Chitinophagales bacterium]